LVFWLSPNYLFGRFPTQFKIGPILIQAPPSPSSPLESFTAVTAILVTRSPVARTSPVLMIVVEAAETTFDAYNVTKTIRNFRMTDHLQVPVFQIVNTLGVIILLPTV